MTTGLDGCTDVDLLSCTVIFTLVEFTTLIVLLSEFTADGRCEFENDTDGSGEVT